MERWNENQLQYTLQRKHKQYKTYQGRMPYNKSEYFRRESGEMHQETFPTRYQHGVESVCLPTSLFPMLLERRQHTFLDIFISNVIRTSKNTILDVVPTLFRVRRERFLIPNISYESGNRFNIYIYYYNFSELLFIQ